jgi:septum formation protein
MNAPHDRSRLILASKSPRRSELLEQAGLTYFYVITLAESKALDISEKHPAAWVIGADTIVLIDSIILGKPDSSEEAHDMLQRLSDKTHQVLTGYCICCKKKNRVFSETVKTDVRFKKLTDAEIKWYLQTGEPFDKAGAYAIQGIGTFLVKSIIGSYTNVVGLPVCEVIEFLTREGVIGRNPENQ